jgi:hypothetical protein
MSAASVTLLRSPAIPLVLGIVAMGFLPVNSAGVAPIVKHDSRDDYDAKILREARVVVELKAVRQFLLDRCGKDEDLLRAKALHEQLGADGFVEREEAMKRLKGLGPAALPWLRAAQTDRDLEVRQRARACIKQITTQWPVHVVTAGIRWYARQRDESAISVLMRLLPYADEFGQSEEIWFALDAKARETKKLDSQLRTLNGDPIALRRAAAAYLLGRWGTSSEQTLARTRLKDSDAHVRLRAAQGLLLRGDPLAVPVLIRLLESGTTEIAWQAEELLHWLVGKDAPRWNVGSGSLAARRKCNEAWQAWWAAKGAKVDFRAPFRANRRPGIVLVFEKDYTASTAFPGLLWACGCDGKRRWQLGELEVVEDLCWLPGGTLLLAEGWDGWVRDVKGNIAAGRNYHFNEEGGVSERDLEGRMLWKHAEIPYPIHCRRLSSGNTVVATEIQIAEVTPQGKITTRDGITNLAAGEIYGRMPQRLSPGRYVIFRVDAGDVLDLLCIDPSGIVHRTTRLQAAPLLERPSALNTVTGRFQVLSNGNYLVTGWRNDRPCREINQRGETVWRSPRGLIITQACSLPTGHILAATRTRAVEMSRSGRIVWEASQQRSDVQRCWPCLNLVRLGFNTTSSD